jgi:hypothetical protein
MRNNRVISNELEHEMGEVRLMEYALGLSLTAVSVVVAIWVNDHFQFGGELQED